MIEAFLGCHSAQQMLAMGRQEKGLPKAGPHTSVSAECWTDQGVSESWVKQYRDHNLSLMTTQALNPGRIPQP